VNGDWKKEKAKERELTLNYIKTTKKKKAPTARANGTYLKSALRSNHPCSLKKDLFVLIY
jgi:hypothetical protein